MLVLERIECWAADTEWVVSIVIFSGNATQTMRIK